MDVAVNGAGSQDLPLTGNDLRARTNDHIHPVLNVGVARFADGGNPAVPQAHVRLDDAPPIQNQGIGDHRVHGAVPTAGLALTHAVPNHLAPAEFHLLPVDATILLHLQDQFRIRQTQAIPHGGAIGFCIGAAIQRVGHGGEDRRVVKGMACS